MPGQARPPIGEEHIIPRSFGGRLILQKASCLSCAKVTNRFETKCLNGMVETARYHLGINSLGRKNRSKAPVRFQTDEGREETVAVPLTEHPSALILPLMKPPGAIMGLDVRHSEPVTIRVSITPITPDFHERAKAFGDRQINLTRGIDAASCYRLIAKISHAHLCAELGVDGFVPTVLHVVQTREMLFADHFIGCMPSFDELSTGQLHDICLAPSLLHQDWEFLVVRVRLFAHLAGTPTYLSVAGRRPIPR